MLATVGFLYLYFKGYLLSRNAISITIQIFAVLLMVWARFTFGLRSFHAAANTTEGKLVTKGPYHYWRHPIYASLIYFSWACLIAYPHLDVVGAVLLITIGLVGRMLLEEKFLFETYPEYKEYSKRTRRLIPFIM